MPTAPTVRVHYTENFRGLDHFRSEIKNQTMGAPGPINDFFTQAAERYLAYAHRKFRINAAGGGSWPKLKPATIAARRLGRGGSGTIGGARKRALSRLRKARTAKSATAGVKGLKLIAAAGANAKILIDTGTLMNALFIGRAGNLIERLPGAIRVGIRGGSHASAGSITIGQIADIHNRGLGNVPKRVIVPEELDATTSSGIRSDLKRAIERLGRQAESKQGPPHG